jgi:hypothetical protein
LAKASDALRCRAAKEEHLLHPFQSLSEATRVDKRNG